LVELKIVMQDDGKIQVTGQLQNKALCYGMLECARDVIKDVSDRAQESKIVRTDSGVLNGLALHKPS
jgi:hypothetical protein